MLGSVRATPGGNTTPIVNTSQAITATSTIAIASGVANQICPVTSAAAITLTSNPQLGTGIAGQRVTIQNAGANTITFTDGNGLSLQGTLAIGSTQFATFVNLGGFWQLESTNGSPTWIPVPFQNSFGNLAGNQNAEYTKWMNEIILRGVATRTGAWTQGLALFVLPIGFRPQNKDRFMTETFNLANAVIEVYNNGSSQLFIAGTAPGTQTVSLEGIRFRV